jgi:predicted 2-oxoglutarate/Fe(II)-dependent dioxygenase YbiX
VIRPTVDTDSPSLPKKIRERLVVFTIFLNDDFEGGEFALLPGFPRPPLVVHASPGTMVAFPADLAHAVRTVTAGRRHSITGWFRAPGQDKQPRRNSEEHHR